jgi:hypothetical protein
MFVVVTMFAAYHVPITATLARGYLTAKANIEAASPQEAVSIKVIEIPGPDIPDVPDVSEHEPARDHELVRLRSMFANRPCPTESQSTEMNPDAEVALPEPGLAQSPECKAEKKPVPE